MMKVVANDISCNYIYNHCNGAPMQLCNGHRRAFHGKQSSYSNMSCVLIMVLDGGSEQVCPWLPFSVVRHV